MSNILYSSVWLGLVLVIFLVLCFLPVKLFESIRRFDHYTAVIISDLQIWNERAVINMFTTTQLNISGAVPGCKKLHPGTAPEHACIRLRSISMLVSTWSSRHVPACRMSRLVSTWSPGHVPACRMSRLVSTWSSGHVSACRIQPDITLIIIGNTPWQPSVSMVRKLNNKIFVSVIYHLPTSSVLSTTGYF